MPETNTGNIGISKKLMVNNPPNIIYIHSHDTGRYIQPYGYPVSTPNLQRLAEEGVLFRKAFAVAPTCSPSRAGLLTGQCAHSSGMLGLAHRGFTLKDYKQHIVHTLRKAGYHSTLCGVQHVADDPEVIGYDEVFELDPNNSNRYVKEREHVVSAAVGYLQAPLQEPFFLSIGFVETHRNGKGFTDRDGREDSRYCSVPSILPDTAETRQDIADFCGSVELLDDSIGEIHKVLDAVGLTDNTLIICTTDHGIGFPGMKCTLTDHGTGVMLILCGQGGFGGGKVYDSLVSQMDIFPTICDILDIPKPDWLQGKSIIPIIRGEKDKINEEIFAEINYHATYEPVRAVRTDRYKYIHRFDTRTKPIIANVDTSPSRDVWLEHGWQNKSIALEQLYDLVFDPAEMCNLAYDPEMKPILKDMRERLKKWMQATDDPLLCGSVPAPQGARLKDPNSM